MDTLIPSNTHCPQQCTVYPNCGCVTTYIRGNMKIRLNTTHAKFWGRRPPLSPTFFYSKTCLLFFPHVVHYPTPPLDTNVVVPPSSGEEATPITNPVLLPRVSLNHSHMHRLPYPTTRAKFALTTM